ncbi:MAG: cyclopropane-fatty-acyl-phospholipid synthase family protein [Steroidobacteraceae bacterium]
MNTATKPSIIPLQTSQAAPLTSKGQSAVSDSMLARLGRKLLFAQLERIEHGEIRIVDRHGERRFGRRHDGCQLVATLHVNHHQLYADAAFAGTVGAGEAYIRGLWHCDDLTALVRIFILNRSVMEGMDSRWAFLSAPLRKVFHLLNSNSREGSARNIAAHYDLGNPLYELMLDDTMAYSCGIFETAASTLRDASIAKFDAACRKLQLRPEDHLLEIGTGWGGLAIHAAQNYGCRVTTTTISQEQHRYAQAKVAKLGLSDRITLLTQDYRDLSGTFDKLVSIEMIEAVGANYLQTYLSQCSRLLKPEGAMLLQAITIRDQFYEQALKSVDYIQRYIFPGSFIPSVTAIGNALTRATDMKIAHLRDIGPHYALTLKLWRERFFERIDQVRQLGYPDSFVRMWDFYLCYCEGGFTEGQLSNVQMLLTKPGYRHAAPGY